MTGSELAPRDRITGAAVQLLIEGGIGAATRSEIVHRAGVAESDYDQHFTSVDSVFVSIVANLLDGHAGNSDGPVQGRGSLVESLQASMRAVWNLMEQRIDEHQALYVIMLAQAADPGLIEGMGFSVHQTHLAIASAYLQEVERVHNISWELPIAQLALLLQATVDGLLVDYVAQRDGSEVRQVLDLFAGQLAQHGRRAYKNHPR